LSTNDAKLQRKNEEIVLVLVGSALGHYELLRTINKH
jgi:hypothetical protein